VKEKKDLEETECLASTQKGTHRHPSEPSPNSATDPFFSSSFCFFFGFFFFFFFRKKLEP
jgi:hypothetical protein